jgi:hypothetical protein
MRTGTNMCTRARTLAHTHTHTCEWLRRGYLVRNLPRRLRVTLLPKIIRTYNGWTNQDARYMPTIEAKETYYRGKRDLLYARYMPNAYIRSCIWYTCARKHTQTHTHTHTHTHAHTHAIWRGICVVVCGLACCRNEAAPHRLARSPT